MEVTYHQLKLAEPVLFKIMYLPARGKRQDHQPEPRQFSRASMSIRFGNLIKAAEPKLQQIDKVRDDLVRRLGVEQDGKFSVPPDKMDEFLKGMDEALQERVNLDCKPIPASWLDAEKIEFSASEAVFLGPFVEED